MKDALAAARVLDWPYQCSRLMHGLVHLSVEMHVNRRYQVILMSNKRVENPYYLFSSRSLNGHAEPDFGEIMMTKHQPYRVKLPSTTAKTHL